MGKGDKEKKEANVGVSRSRSPQWASETGSPWDPLTPVHIEHASELTHPRVRELFIFQVFIYQVIDAL